MVLSPDQFSGLHGDLFNDAGGFSVNASSGKSPTSGIMVSDEHGEETRPLLKTQPEHLQKYVARNWQHLQGGEKYFGGWTDREAKPATVSLDRSTRYPADQSSLAFVRMVAQHQKAAFNLGTGQEIRNPSYTPDKRQRLRRMAGENVS